MGARPRPVWRIIPVPFITFFILEAEISAMAFSIKLKVYLRVQAPLCTVVVLFDQVSLNFLPLYFVNLN